MNRRCVQAVDRSSGAGSGRTLDGRGMIEEGSWPRGRSCRNGAVSRVVHVPYSVFQDEEGVWCASAQLGPGVGAVGDGPTEEAAVGDVRAALEVLLAETGPPPELTLTLDVD